MTLKEAMDIMNKTDRFMITFDVISSDKLKYVRSDSFPSGTEADPLISSKVEAIALARKFAEKAPPYYVNIRIADYRRTIASGVTHRLFTF